MKKKLAVITIGLSLAGLFFISCDKKIGKAPVVAPAATTSASTSTANACDTITYNKHIKPIIVANCNSCHAPGTLSSGFDLSTYALLKAKAAEGKLKKRVIDDVPPNSMPQGSPKLGQSKLDQILCWINNGTKEN